MREETGGRIMENPGGQSNDSSFPLSDTGPFQGFTQRSNKIWLKCEKQLCSARLEVKILVKGLVKKAREKLIVVRIWIYFKDRFPYTLDTGRENYSSFCFDVILLGRVLWSTRTSLGPIPCTSIAPCPTSLSECSHVPQVLAFSHLLFRL